MSVLITLASILTAKYFIFVHFVKKALIQELGEEFAKSGAVSISPFDTVFLKSLIDPIGLLILLIALYISFVRLKPRRI